VRQATYRVDLALARLRRASDAEIDQITADGIHAELDRRAAQRDPSAPRPAWLTVSIDGVSTRVSIEAHDAYYRERRRALRRGIRDAHPDAKHRARVWRYARQGKAAPDPLPWTSRQMDARQRALRSWMEDEREWYWQFRLMPPGWKGPTQEPKASRPVLGMALLKGEA
jgi:hypothetical protein